MALDTVIQQGRFTSTGTAVTLNLRSDVDWIWVYNETILNDAALAADRAAMCYFQRGMTNGRGVEHRKLGTVANDPMTTLQLAANAGFFLRDTSAAPETAAIAQTAITNATQPVVTTANTGALVTGSVVRLTGDTGQTSTQGFDFEVDTVVADTSFRMRFALANAPGVVGTGDGEYRHIRFDPLYYPRRRFIVNATRAASMVVTVSVSHGYTVGQAVRLHMPAPYLMIEADGLVGTITATTASTITLDIDSTDFTAFAFPAAADVPFTWAQVVPFGEDTAEALDAAVDILGDATVNQSLIGVELAGGNNSPAGATNDVIYWVAGKSFAVNN